MNSSTVRFTIVVVVWLVSLLAAFHFGKRWQSFLSGAESAAPDTAALPASSKQGQGDVTSRQAPATGDVALGGRVASNGSSTENRGPDTAVVERITEAGEVDVHELIASMRAQFGSGPRFMHTASSMVKTMAPVVDLSKAQIFEALDEVSATVKGPRQQMIFHQLLLGRLAEVDGQAAMSYLSNHLSDQNNQADGLSMTVMAGWAQREPDNAWQWFMDHRDDLPSGQSGDSQLQFIFSGMAAKDIDGAFRRLEELDDFEKKQAVAGIAMSSGGNSGSQAELLERGASLPDDLRDSLYQGVFSQWAMTDPEGAIEWARGLPEEAKQKVVQQSSVSLLSTNPELGAEFMLENASEDELPNTYSNIVATWASQNPNAAGDWLNEQPPGPELDEARARFAGTVVQRDPFAAMAWAKSVGTESRRIQSIRQVFVLWHSKHPVQADDALNSTGLRQEMIDEIRLMVEKTAVPIEG